MLNLQITTRHTGKMYGMVSVSTSTLDNPICQARAQNGDSICSHCYAQRMTKAYKGLHEKLHINTELLTKEIHDADDFPIINAAYIRLEAFGDLMNDIQVKNYFNLCRRNPHATFALWTKNPNFIKAAISDGYKKPNNLIVILSSPIINSPLAGSIVAEYPFIDHVFTVYTKDNDAHINCGGNHCLSCRRCYSRKTSFYVNERLK